MGEGFRNLPSQEFVFNRWNMFRKGIDPGMFKHFFLGLEQSHHSLSFA